MKYALNLFILFHIGCSYTDTAVPPPALCETPMGCCGNDRCEPWETILSSEPSYCPADCHCGDGVCDPDYGEDQEALFCESDCGCPTCTGNQLPCRVDHGPSGVAWVCVDDATACGDICAGDPSLCWVCL